MKILIATDMEGITGVVSWNQVTPGHAEYGRFRKLMTADVNAAIKGAFEGGATEVVVADGHWNGENILVEELDPRAKLNSGLATAPLSMMQGLDESVDGVIFVGYHARAGSEFAVLDHTWNLAITNVWLNDVLVGEFGLNAALAGYFGVPVIMVTGDQTACAQCEELLGKLETVIVKQATGRFSAQCQAPAVTQSSIQTAARQAVARLKKGDATEPFIMDAPIQVTLEFSSSQCADKASRYPGAERDGNRVVVPADDALSALVAFRVAAGLAGE